MTTNVSGTSARQDPRQVSNTMRGSIVFNSAASGVFVPFGVLPKGAWVIAVQMSVDTTFNGTGPTLSVGTSGTPTQFFSAASAAAGMQAAAIGTLGKAAAAAADTVVGMTFNFTGSPTQGAAEVLIEYEGGFPSTPGVEFSG